MDLESQGAIYNYPYGYRGQKLGGRLFRQVARVGELAPDFTIHTLDSGQVTLSSYFTSGYTVLQFGSFTCPLCVTAVPDMERLAGKYRPKEMNFAFVYTREAHPGRRYPHHTTFDQKVACARMMRENLGVTRPILVDDLDGRVHLLYGGVNAMTYVIDKNGIIVFRQYYTDTDLLSKALAQFDKMNEERRFSGNFAFRGGYKSAYCEWKYDLPVDMKPTIEWLKNNGPESIMDMALPQIRAGIRARNTS